MKNILLVLFISTFTLPIFAQTSGNTSTPDLVDDVAVEKIICDGDTKISENMGKMGFIIRTLNELVYNLVAGDSFESLKVTAMNDNRLLRAHLITVLPKTPEKIKNIDPKNIQKNKLIYQRYILKMIGFSVDLEDELRKKPTTPEEVEIQRIKITSLVVKIDETVSTAHNLFRF